MEKNDYVVQVKHSKKTLTKLVKECVQTGIPISQEETIEINRGRKEHRILSVYEPNSRLKIERAKLTRVISVRRIRECKGKKSDCVHYYITSLRSKNAKFYLDIIRKHWWVENKLHYVKDVILKEDATSFCTYERVKKNAVYRNVIFSCIKLNGFKSIKQALEKCAANIKLCYKLIRT